jgi:purine-binding chemotaxis protein CheW
MPMAQARDTDVSLHGMTETKQYLTFLMAETEYGVDVLRVQEIRGWDAVTPLPNTPAYVRGVMNLRGTIVPIIDLRQRFGLECIPYGPTTVVVVTSVRHDHASRVMGLVVDAVSDVYTVSDADMQPPPDCGGAISTQVVHGLATVGEKMVIVLALEQLMPPGEWAAMDNPLL